MDNSQDSSEVDQPEIGDSHVLPLQILPLDLSMANLRASSPQTENDSESRTELYVPPKKRLTWRGAQRSSVKNTDVPAESATCSGALDLTIKGVVACKDKAKQAQKRRKPSRTYDFGTGTSKRQKKKKVCAASSKNDVALTPCVPPKSSSYTSTDCLKTEASGTTCHAVKSMCTLCAKNWKPSSPKKKPCRKRTRDAAEFENRRQSQRLVIKNLKLPFSELPPECKLTIFSFLSPQERCVAALVCHAWNDLICLPGLWSDVNLNIFDATMMNKGSGSPKMGMCAKFNQYMVRMRKYFAFLNGVNPAVKSLAFRLDVAHPRDNWLQLIVSLLEAALCDGLQTVDIDWTVTPVRPCQVDLFCCVFNKVRSAFRHHRLRVKCFHQLMATLTTRAPHVRTLRMPFDWSARSVLHLCRLRQLEVLKLTKYISLSRLTQDLLDTVLDNLPCLRHLELDMCMATYSSETLYSLSHRTLETLDLSHSQGFYLKRISLPRLRTVSVNRSKWQGPLAPGRCEYLPCFYNLFTVGAPNLSIINRYRLQAYWRDFLYDELDVLLKKLCPCKEHAVPTAAVQPAAVQPAAVQPAAVQPAAVQPAAGQPAAGQPAAGQPAAGQPAAVQPAAVQPAVGQPAAVQPAGHN